MPLLGEYRDIVDVKMFLDTQPAPPTVRHFQWGHALSSADTLPVVTKAPYALPLQWGRALSSAEIACFRIVAPRGIYIALCERLPKRPAPGRESALTLMCCHLCSSPSTLREVGQFSSPPCCSQYLVVKELLKMDRLTPSFYLPVPGYTASAGVKFLNLPTVIRSLRKTS